MKNFIKKHLNTIFLIFLPLVAGFYLWQRSCLPPNGYVLSELSDQYWGLIIDIARKWQSGQFSFWDRSIGGGFCLFSSGFYPIWEPGNVMALFMNFDQFFLFKLIEPYSIGIFCTFLLLRIGLKLSLAWSCFGSLLYTGFHFTRFVAILHYPFFIWACALFPMILYFYNKFFNRPFYFRAPVLGALMAVIFLGGGAGQFAQLIIWTLILLSLEIFLPFQPKPLRQKIMEWVGGCGLFLFFAFSLAGSQMIPTIAYTLFESIRTEGVYAINNFPIFKNEFKGTTSLTNILYQSFFIGGGSGVKAFGAILIFAVGKMIADWKYFCRWWTDNRAMTNVVLTTIIFFLLPPAAQRLVHIFPFLTPLFNPLRMFTFGYCGFMIDMLYILFLAIVFCLKRPTPAADASQEDSRNLILLVFFVLAEIYLFLPFWLDQPPLAEWLRTLVTDYQLMDRNVSFADRMVTMIALGLMAFPAFQKTKWKPWVLGACFMFLGSQLLLSGYSCGTKGQRPTENFYFSTPEHTLYRHMKGHYYIAYSDPDGPAHRYDSMTHNYDLLFGVHGVNGFLNIPPKRFTKFIEAYQPVSANYKFHLFANSPALASHFPVEFTTIKKGMPLPWPSFKKVLAGQNYDIWVSETPPPRVKFADRITITSLDKIVRSFDLPYEGMFYMTPQDALNYPLPDQKTLTDYKKAQYHNFQESSPDHRSFDVTTDGPALIVLPEIFQKGWRVLINGKPGRVFPANYIFSGFKVDEKMAHIELYFRPVLWEIGIAVNIIGFLLFAGILVIYFDRKKKQVDFNG